MALKVPFDPAVPDSPDLKFHRTLSEAFGAGSITMLDTQQADTLRSERNAAWVCLLIIAICIACVVILK